MPRLRIGIGRPSGKTAVDRYVLGRFSQEEQNVLDSVKKQSVDVLLTFLTDLQSQTSPAEGRRASRKNKARTLSQPQDTTEEHKQNWPPVTTTHYIFDNCSSFVKELHLAITPCLDPQQSWGHGGQNQNWHKYGFDFLTTLLWRNPVSLPYFKVQQTHYNTTACITCPFVVSITAFPKLGFAKP